jgi:SAM-dependent methyltransferase
MTRCNICGSTAFQPGFRGRLSFGQPPECANCHSVERHRVIHEIYKAVAPLLSDWRALQFAPDQSVEAAWFGKFDTSVYGDENFMDMTDTGLQSESYDLIISNHVLEHVANDRAALIELLRVVGESGVVHLCVPSPLARWETLDWGFPDPDKNLHYRDYGAGFPIGMLEHISEANAIAVVGRDTVTGLYDIVYFFSRSIERLARMANLWQRAYIAVVRFT